MQTVWKLNYFKLLEGNFFLGDFFSFLNLALSLAMCSAMLFVVCIAHNASHITKIAYSLHRQGNLTYW